MELRVSMQEVFQEYPPTEGGGPGDSVGVSLAGSVLSYYCIWLWMLGFHEVSNQCCVFP